MHIDAQTIKATEVLQRFLDQGNQSIPAHAIARARGIAIMHVIRAGFHYSSRFGSGVVIARLPDGSWSAPSKIKTAGVGAGFLIGAEVTDHVMILNTEDAVAAFYQENVTIGGNFALTAGPVGQSTDATCTIVGKQLPVYAYSKTRGLYAGISLEGGAIFEGKDANSSFYGRPISAREILTGFAERPVAAAALYSVLETCAAALPDSIPNYTEKSPNAATSTSNTAPLPEPRVFNIPIFTETVFCVAIHDYEGTQAGDLSFKEGETIRVTKRNTDGWWFGSIEKKEGTFPSNHVRQV
ncbi:hypothetical protein BDR26DRAFT_911134 [Obelidium mucronatum]|nr:hypothetical protein BDR26DRAFT_911134 [Obelidium mucronatum]